VGLEELNIPAAVTARIKELVGTSGAAVSGVNKVTTLVAYNGDGL
jgi:hypothetical protein